MTNKLSVACAAITFMVLSSAPQAAPQKEAARSAAEASAQRALLDQYCVTCHNDRLKRANLSLEKLDLTKVTGNPQLWEKVIRKLRAGVMPPPGMRRPEPAQYTALTEFLENQIDRKALADINPERQSSSLESRRIRKRGSRSPGPGDRSCNPSARG
jgi:cytochrome c5